MKIVVRFSARAIYFLQYVQTGSGAHPPSCLLVVIGSFNLWWSGWVVQLTARVSLVLKLSINVATCLHAVRKDTFYFV